MFELRPVGENTFDPDATGLDHLSFAVESRDALEQAVTALSDAGIAHGEVTDLEDAGIAHGEVTDLEDAGIAILSFQDPDDINIELTAPLG